MKYNVMEKESQQKCFKIIMKINKSLKIVQGKKEAQIMVRPKKSMKLKGRYFKSYEGSMNNIYANKFERSNEIKIFTRMQSMGK